MSRRDSRSGRAGTSPRARLNPHIRSIAIGDRVRISDNRTGEVKFIGPTDFHDGIWYGLALDTPQGKHNGTFRNRQYFECEEKRGTFVQRDRVQDIISESIITPRILRLDYADVVDLPDRGRGYIRFVGPVHFQSDSCWFGIELAEEKGKNNGTIQGVRYFSCLQKHGILLNGKKLSAQLAGERFTGVGSPPANMDARPHVWPTLPYDDDDVEADDEDEDYGDDGDDIHLDMDRDETSMSISKSSSSYPYDTPHTNRLHSVDERDEEKMASPPKQNPSPSPESMNDNGPPSVAIRQASMKISIDEAEVDMGPHPVMSRDRSHTFNKISIDSTENAKMMSFEHGKFNLKCVVFGDTKVGKTSIVRRFTKHRFNLKYKMTVGYQKTVRDCEVPIEIVEEMDDDSFLFSAMDAIDERNLTSISDPNGGVHVTRREGSVEVALQIVDAGLHAQNTDLLKGVAAIVLVADFAKRSSMEQLVRWYRHYLEQTPQDTKRRRSSHFRKHKKENTVQHVVIVCANKSELDPSRRMFTMDELTEYVDNVLRPYILKAHAPANEVNDSPFSPPSIADMSGTVLTPRSHEIAELKEQLSNGGLREHYEDEDDRHEYDGFDGLERTYSTASRASQSSVSSRKESDLLNGGTANVPQVNIPIEIMECSAKTGSGVEMIFQTIMQHLIPPRLVSSSHKRKKTAQIRAPLVIRRALQAFDDSDDDDEDTQKDSTTNLGFEFGLTFESEYISDDAQELDDAQAFVQQRIKMLY